MKTSILVVASLALASCTPGAGGDGGTTSTGGASTNSGGGGAVTSSGGGGATTISTSNTSPSCTAVGFKVGVAYTDADGNVIDCSLPPTPGDNHELDADGLVTSSSPNHLEVDTCAPGTGCAPSVVKVNFGARDDLTLPIPVGTPVHLHVGVSAGDYYCSTGVEITNLASWAGVTNPATPRSIVWLELASQTAISPQVDGPDYGLEPIHLHDCVPESPTLVIDDERLYDAQDQANAVIVHVGEIGVLHVQRDGKPETWTYGNGEAGCDDIGTPCPSEGYPYHHYFTMAPGD